MRRGREESTWKNDEGQVIALNIGADYCAEHEWGINDLKRDFGIPDSDLMHSINPSRLDKIKAALGFKKEEPVGIATRTISKSDMIVHNLESGPKKIDKGKGAQKMWGFAAIPKWRHESWDFEGIRDCWWDPERHEFQGWWAGRSLAVLYPEKEVIRDFVDAFERNDIAIWIGASRLFKNGGLIIAIVSRLPKEFTDEMKEADLDRIKLTEAAVSTGVYDRLSSAKREYYALSPRWKDAEKKEVVFWLNPMDQPNNNSGWYSVQELDEWCKGMGPIPKNK